MIVTGTDTGAPDGSRSVPDKRNPCARARSRPNVAAWGTMIRARNTALPNRREAYTSYVPGARDTEYEPLESAEAGAEIAPPPLAVKVMLASTPRPARVAIPETVVLSSVRVTARSSLSEAWPGVTVAAPAKAYRSTRGTPALVPLLEPAKGTVAIPGTRNGPY